jgi:hypothetical protein
MLNVSMLSVVMLSVGMQNVAAPPKESSWWNLRRLTDHFDKKMLAAKLVQISSVKSG